MVLQFNEFLHSKGPSAHTTLTKIYKDNLDDNFIFSRLVKLGTIETINIWENPEKYIFFSINRKPYFLTQGYNVRRLGAQYGQEQ